MHCQGRAPGAGASTAWPLKRRAFTCCPAPGTDLTINTWFRRFKIYALGFRDTYTHVLLCLVLPCPAISYDDALSPGSKLVEHDRDYTAGALIIRIGFWAGSDRSLWRAKLQMRIGFWAPLEYVWKRNPNLRESSGPVCWSLPWHSLEPSTLHMRT